MLSVKQGGIKYNFFESLVSLDQGLNPGHYIYKYIFFEQKRDIDICHLKNKLFLWKYLKSKSAWIRHCFVLFFVFFFVSVGFFVCFFVGGVVIFGGCCINSINRKNIAQLSGV